jgi:hypothetical protein
MLKQTRNEQVSGSNPLVGSLFSPLATEILRDAKV